MAEEFNQYTMSDVDAVVGILTANHDLSQEAVVARVTNSLGTEAGFSEEMVRATPSFKAHFVSQGAATTVNTTQAATEPVEEQKPAEGDSGKK